MILTIFQTAQSLLCSHHTSIGNNAAAFVCHYLSSKHYSSSTYVTYNLCLVLQQIYLKGKVFSFLIRHQLPFYHQRTVHQAFKLQLYYDYNKQKISICLFKNPYANTLESDNIISVTLDPMISSHQHTKRIDTEHTYISYSKEN